MRGLRNTTQQASAGPLVGVVVILFILCAGAGYLFVRKQTQRAILSNTTNRNGTTTIDLGTTTIQQ